MKEMKIQWHAAFVSAMSLDFGSDRADLIFEKEYNLNTKPLEIDLLVIKKEASFQIASEIGMLFYGAWLRDCGVQQRSLLYRGKDLVSDTDCSHR
ncbi:MAG: hypothetical protein NC092_00250 [Butyrivibrio sp.]|nr:hypothetical protein [Muribaculum sp.]MCM1551104.1 hypothetical protein [Butyrivibrio sp.]